MCQRGHETQCGKFRLVHFKGSFLYLRCFHSKKKFFLIKYSQDWPFPFWLESIWFRTSKLQVFYLFVKNISRILFELCRFQIIRPIRTSSWMLLSFLSPNIDHPSLSKFCKNKFGQAEWKIGLMRLSCFQIWSQKSFYLTFLLETPPPLTEWHIRDQLSSSLSCWSQKINRASTKIPFLFSEQNQQKIIPNPTRSNTTLFLECFVLSFEILVDFKQSLYA